MTNLQLPVEALKDVVLATNNPKKLIELRRIFEAEQIPVQVHGLSDFERYDEPAETDLTFEGNALIKARAAAAHTGIVALADDSGLEVDALNRMPGVRSARWAGLPADDRLNLDLLVAQTEDLTDEQRTARFVCALAMVTPDGSERVWLAAMEGRLAVHPVGENGFGYDPIFIPEGYDVTSAQLPAEEKDRISHRGKAIRMMVDEIRALPGVEE